jgi:aryl-alcohol dehydrogenase-like predicted oxidoreductase
MADRNPIVALQVRYNLANRDAERELLPTAEKLGMTLAAWSPLGGGLLSASSASPGVTATSLELPPTRSATAIMPSPVPCSTWPTTSERRHNKSPWPGQ